MTRIDAASPARHSRRHSSSPARPVPRVAVWIALVLALTLVLGVGAVAAAPLISHFAARASTEPFSLGRRSQAPFAARDDSDAARGGDPDHDR